MGAAMATPGLTGYGLGASSASVPFFEGKREDFADFRYKLRAVKPNSGQILTGTVRNLNPSLT